ncbi:hypothetical protein [Microseira wollei]|uniref:Uncharacterized protein n=1 Tax=Microseira wollei NIES-4236 TaxID=2530354 RepID=A0AAV3X598_9CYAN|nr:hypothetical protein [Microseira wollei]GET35489.1 hypothetical protein MiSe_02310 [Microseira wollei NIES-4236]
MTVVTADLMTMSQSELDDLYKRSFPGAIPNGDGRGTAIIAAGSVLSKSLAPIVKLLAWRGKFFYADQSFLLNKITPLSLKLIKAQIYRGESWIDGKETIILDYSKTSFVAQRIRDEIREVSPGLYLGQAYWGKSRVLNFILEFSNSLK